MWNQVYNPLGSSALSTLAAALPVVTLLVLIASGKVKAHIAAVIALVVANLVAILIFTMPAGLALRAAVLGAVTGFFPIGWIVLNVIFLYRLTVEKGAFETLQQTIGGVTAGPAAAAPADRLLLRRLLRGRLGLRHAGRGDRRDPDRPRLLAARGLGPVADRQHGAGRLRRARHADRRASPASPASIPYLLGAMVGRQLPFFSLIVPFWLIWAFAGWRGMMEIWPAILVTGVSFAVPQFLISNFINPWIVDIGASLISMACLIGFLQVWQPERAVAVAGAAQPRRLRRDHAGRGRRPRSRSRPPREVWRALHALDHRLRRSCWSGAPAGSRASSTRSPPGTTRFPSLHNMINKVPPVAAKPTPEGAVFALHLALLHRLRHADRRDHLGLRDGLLAAHGWSRPTAGRSRSAPIRSSPSRRCWRSAR